MDKMKLVIWDLDNTIWDGILLENNEIILRREVLNILQSLDQRGILQSIVSKNEYSLAYSKLKELKIDHFFILPQITWNAKSTSVNYLIKKLDIDQKFVIFIDDQETELREIIYAFPNIQVFDAKDLNNILLLPSLMPDYISEEAHHRRNLYLIDLQRKNAHQEFCGSNEDFLKTLGIELTIRKAHRQDIKRIRELTQRTHQLNSTGVCYSHEQLLKYSQSDNYILLIVEMSDNYGNYGKIGFALIYSQGTSWVIKLILVSCRVITYGIGMVFLNLIREIAKNKGKRLFAEYSPNKANSLMNVALRFTGFKEYSTGGDIHILHNDFTKKYLLPEYIKVKYAIDDILDR